MARLSRTVVARLPLVALFVALVLQPVHAGPLTQAMPHATGTRAIVLEQLEALLAADKELQLVGQGSWLRSGAAAASKAGGVSREYRDPLLTGAGASDHDLRLVMKGREEAALGARFAALSETERAAIRARDEIAIAAKWIEARKGLVAAIQKAVPASADVKTLEQTLLRYGFSAQEAAAISKTGAKNVLETVLGSVNLYAPPSLIRMAVDDKTARATYLKIGGVPNLAGREVEGVWGLGASAATQEFEAGGAIGTGDMSLVAKYLKRLKGTWALAIRKGGLRAESLQTSIAELNAFIAAAEKGEAAVLEGGRTLQRFLRTARMQSSVMGQLARNSGSVDREIMLAILEARPLSRWEKVGTWFREVWPSAENLAMFERAMQGAFLVFSTWQVSGTWGEKGMEDALRQAGVEGAMLLSLPVGAMMALTNSLLDNAREFGYNSAVKPQEWREFLAGISSVAGYEGMTNLELSIEQDGKATEVSTTTNLKELLAPQAFRFSGRGSYSLSARFKLELRAPSLGTMDEARDVYDAQPLLARVYERRIPFAVDVIAPSKGHWKFVGADDSDLRQSGRQPAAVCRGCEPAWTVGEVIIAASSVTARFSASRDVAVDARTVQRKPYTLEQVLSWTGLPDVIVPGVTYTTTATLSWTTSDEAVMPAKTAYVQGIHISLPMDILEPDRNRPQVTAQWKLDDPGTGEVRLGGPPFSFWVQMEFKGPGGAVHRLLRWDWVSDIR